MSTSFVTFYSFKGGVGRTQALANTAVALANRGYHVVMIDMDLESPGLHAFFSPKEKPAAPFLEADLAHQAGLLEYVEHCQTQPKHEPSIEPFTLPCTHEFQRDGQLSLLLPGRLDDTYADRIAQFSWERFYEEADGYRYIEHLRMQLSRIGADYVLIDSRTGMTDVAMIGTFQLPDVVVVLFALHRQGVDGARRIARAIERRRSEEGDDFRPRKVLLVPSRVDENGETSLLNQWMDIARRQLQGIHGAELVDKLGERVPYWPRMAYGEQVLDLAAEANPLTAAYQRLVEQILSIRSARESPEKADAYTQEAPAPFMPALKRTANVLQSRIDELSNELASRDLSTMPLKNVVGWARAAEYRRTVLVADFEVFRANLALLFEQAGEAVPISLEEPRTIAEWCALPQKLDGLVDRGLHQWREAVRQRLLDIERDESLVAEVWPGVEQATAEESLEEARAKIEAFHEKIRVQSLFGLLGKNALEHDIFSQRVPEDARKEWIRGRIQYLLEESPWDYHRTTLAFWNLLRLKLHFDPEMPPTPQEWSAYDFVCLYFEKDQAGDRALFQDLGSRLWGVAWSTFFREIWGNSVDATSPGGTDARAQLVRIAREQSFLLDPVVSVVTGGLRNVFERELGPSKNRFMAALFERRREDPCLRKAVAEVGQHGTSPGARRRLLAHWFSVEEPVGDEGRLFATSFVRSLVEDGSVGDAFYVLRLMAQRDPAILANERNAVALAAFSKDLISRAHWDSLALLLSDAAFVYLLLTSRAGQGLTAALAGEFMLQAVPEHASALARGGLLHSTGMRRPLPETLLDWLRWLEQGGRMDETLVGQVKGAVDEARAIGKRGIYGNWPPAIWYENDLKNLCEREAQRVIQALPGTDYSVEINANNEKWIRASFEAQRERGLKTQYPTNEAHKHIIGMLQELDSTLQSLNELRESYRRGPLASLLEMDEKKQQARSALESWLTVTPRHDSVDDYISTQVLEMILGSAK